MTVCLSFLMFFFPFSMEDNCFFIIISVFKKNASTGLKLNNENSRNFKLFDTVKISQRLGNISH